MRLNPNCIAKMIYEQIIVQRDIAFPLEQRFMRILIEKIAIDEITIICTRSRERPVPNQYIGPRHFPGRSPIRLTEDIVANDRCIASIRYLRQYRARLLMLLLRRDVVPDDPNESEAEAAEHLWRAVRIVAIADIIMSLDNVIAIAAAAGGNMALLVIGLAISIPLIVAGAALIMSLLDRFPILVWAGAALLGWIVGEVIATDPVVEGWLKANYGPAVAHQVEIASAIIGAVLVLVVGGLWRRSKVQAESKA